MLRSIGFECHDAYNGADALRILAAHPEIDMLFADVRMPGMSGIELAKEARRMRPALDVILTSGWVGEDDVPDLPFVPKPIRLSRLKSAIAQTGVARRAALTLPPLAAARAHVRSRP
jgi:CheY-like chemotaxis protein